MKIIKKGLVPEELPVQVTCNHCRSILEFLITEARFTSDQRDGDFYTINCPVCHHDINIQASVARKQWAVTNALIKTKI